jgi:hypothetical protein
MALRLHRVTDEQWQRLAASRRAEDRAGTPPRAAIGAIEKQLRSLERLEPFPEPEELREAAAG